MSDDTKQQNFPAENSANAPQRPNRRRLAALGVGTPLIYTLSARSVLATQQQCLSNMLSGNLSNHNHVANCQKGWSPGGWKTPGGAMAEYGNTPAAWEAIGYNYGTMKSVCPPSGKAIDCYNDDGTKLSEIPSWLVKVTVDANSTVRSLLADSSAGKELTRALIAAYFNAKLSAVSPSFKYILTEEQLYELARIGGTRPPEPFQGDLTGFLKSTFGPLN